MRKKRVLSIGLLVCTLLLVATGSVFAEVTIKYANWQWLEPGRADVLQKFVDEFEKANPGIKVEKVSVPYTSYNDALSTQLAAGHGPDIMFVQDMALIPWIEDGFLEPLGKWVDLSKYRDDFPPQQSTAVREGTTYAVLYEGFPYGGMIYNKALLDEAGVDVPTTPEELLAASEAVYEATGMPGLIHPTNISNHGYIMQGGMIVIMGFGGRIVKDGEFAVDQPEFIKGVEFLRKIYELKSHPAGMQFGLQRQQFLAGQAAIVLDGSYWPSIVLLNNPDLYKQIGVAKLPFPDPASPFETNWYALNANSPDERKEAAAKFLEFLLKPEIAEEWALASSIPGLQFTYDAVQEEYPWFEVYAAASPHGVVRPLPGYEAETPEIRVMVAEAIGTAMTGQATPEEAMKRLKQDLLNRFGKR